MRLGLLVLVLVVVHLARTNRNPMDFCEFFGHDAHWQTPTLRVCRNCPMTWRRDVGDIGATTTNQPYGW